MTIRVLIVDDEYPAREQLRHALEKYPELEIIGEATSAREAFQLIEAVEYDALFLDINLPGASGLELARAVREKGSGIKYVFVTAFEEYAVEAFRLRATDYLLKPVSEERLAETVNRLMQTEESPHPTKHPGTPEIAWIAAEKTGTKVPVPLAEVVLIAADGYNVIVHTAHEQLPTRFTLQELSDRLPLDTFFRCHRSYIINIHKVKEIIPYFNGTYLLRMKDKNHTEVPVSRSRSRELRHLFSLA